MRSLVALALVSTLALAAQDRIPPERTVVPRSEAFFPDGYTVFAELDAKELRASTWFRTAVRKRLLGGQLDRLLEKTGLSLDDLDRVVLAGSSNDWSRLAVLLHGSPRIDARKLAARFLSGASLRAESVGSVEILLPPAGGRNGASPALASPAAGQVALGPADLLRAALEGREDGVPSEFLAACLPRTRATFVGATSQEEALADVAKLLGLGKGTELAAASVSVALAPTLAIELRIRLLEGASAPIVLDRGKRLLERLGRDLKEGGCKRAARLISHVELSRQGAAVVAALAAEGEDSSAASVEELLEEAARALGAASGRASPGR